MANKSEKILIYKSEIEFHNILQVFEIPQFLIQADYHWTTHWPFMWTAQRTV